MYGPYPIRDVVKYVERDSIGVYILSRDGKYAHYVGRSDSDLRNRIISSSNEGKGYRYFWFEYANSPMNAYRLESGTYRKYDPIDNSVHPAVPFGTYWRCPVAGCEWA